MAVNESQSIDADLADVLNRYFHNWAVALMFAPWLRRHWDDLQKVLDDHAETCYNDLMTEDTPIPVLTIRFTAVNQPSGRPDADRVQDIPADQCTAGTMFNFDYAAGCPRGHEAPIGSILTLEQPSGYVRTWTLLDVTEPTSNKPQEG